MAKVSVRSKDRVYLLREPAMFIRCAECGKLAHRYYPKRGEPGQLRSVLLPDA